MGKVNNIIIITITVYKFLKDSQTNTLKNLKSIT